MELYINGANPKTNSRIKSELEKDIRVAKISKQKAKQFNSLGNLRKILPVSMLFNSSTVLVCGTQIHCHEYGLYSSYHCNKKFKVLLCQQFCCLPIFYQTQYLHTRNILFCNILKSGESSISVPSLYHSTFGEGAPFTRHSKTTSCPSEAEISCNI